ncbi:MAG: hypothetical protein MRZ79_24995 [Bacteroidia bacterium]|nr:hypothetical protein [Bacteroidia bacterium]
MKNFIQKTLVLLAFTSLLLGGCTQLSNSELLTSEPWKLTDLTSNDADQDFVDLAKALYSDATFDYMASGSFEITFTDTTFTAEGGTWAFSDDETELLITQTGEPTETLSIVTLDEDNFSYNFTDSTGTYLFSFGH